MQQLNFFTDSASLVSNTGPFLQTANPNIVSSDISILIDDLFLQIFSVCGLQEIGRLSSVSKKIGLLVNSEFVWRSLYLQDDPLFINYTNRPWKELCKYEIDVKNKMYCSPAVQKRVQKLQLKEIKQEEGQALTPYDQFKIGICKKLHPRVLFGLRKNFTATDLRSAYTRLVKILHPDKNHGREAEATKLFIILQIAHEITKD